VVEDDRDLRELLVELLRDEGYEAVAAGNGLEGLAMARTHHPDLILLDLLMPIMNGWQFRAAQALEPALAHVPTVVISDHDHDLRVAASLKKPASIGEVLEVVHRYAD